MKHRTFITILGLFAVAGGFLLLFLGAMDLIDEAMKIEELGGEVSSEASESFVTDLGLVGGGLLSIIIGIITLVPSRKVRRIRKEMRDTLDSESKEYEKIMKKWQKKD